MYQVRDDVDTVAATGTPAPVDADRIEQGFKLLWHVPDKTIIPPVFVQDVGVFFVVDQSSVGWLQFWQWNSVANYWEYKTRI